MNDRKLGKAMATDSEVESQAKDASSHSAASRSSQSHSCAPLTRARSNPRNRINAPQDPQVLARPKRWQSERLTKSQVRDAQAAARFAHEIGHPLNLSIDINWTRTWVGNDPDGQILSRLLELTRKWLKPRYASVFAQIAVRENPNGCSNTHILVHCPPLVFRQFKGQVRNVLSEACRGLNDGAVVFKRIGNSNSTLQATLGKLDYMCKGMDPKDAKEFGIHPVPQGPIFGKRVVTSQDIHRKARRQHAEAAGG